MAWLHFIMTWFAANQGTSDPCAWVLLVWLRIDFRLRDFARSNTALTHPQIVHLNLSSFPVSPDRHAWKNGERAT